MTDEPVGGLATVAELMNRDELDISGPVFCPNCGNCDTLIGVRGEITAFELLSCPGCGVELLPEVAVFVSRKFYDEYGDPTSEELKECVTSYWERVLTEASLTEAARGRGRTAEPPAAPGGETLPSDYEIEAEGFDQWADEFGWDWSADHGDAPTDARGEGGDA